MKYEVIAGVEMAPANACIVCAKTRPAAVNDWGIYLAGAVPLGAIVCSAKCALVAAQRMVTTGRVDAGEPKR